MDEQLRPVDTDRAMDCALAEAGYSPLPEYVARHNHHAHELTLLQEVADIVRQARAEFAANCPIAGRLEVRAAIRKLDLVQHGEMV